MLTLSLIRFSPISKETTLIAVVLGVMVFLVDNALMTNSTVLSSFTAALLAGVCWYVYKVFDGVTYDGCENALSSLIGISIVISLCAAYYAS